MRMKLIKTLFLCLAVSISFNLPAKDTKPSSIVVMSYNIRSAENNDGTNSWVYRYPASAVMIDEQKPDIVGIQEGIPSQLKYMKVYTMNNNLKETILFNKKTLSVGKSGSFEYGSWAVVKKKSGPSFFFVSVLFGDDGTTSTEEEIESVKSIIEKHNTGNLPTVVVGDITSLDGFFDARKVASSTDDVNSYNGWGKAKETRDFIWFSGFSSCLEFKTVTDKYRDLNFISDHYPIKATLIF